MFTSRFTSETIADHAVIVPLSKLYTLFSLVLWSEFCVRYSFGYLTVLLLFCVYKYGLLRTQNSFYNTRENIATRWDPYDRYPHDSNLFILFELLNLKLYTIYLMQYDKWPIEPYKVEYFLNIKNI